MTKDEELARDRAAWLESFLVYMTLHERGLGCPDPMFFDGAMPTTGSTLEAAGGPAGDFLRAADRAERPPAGALIGRNRDGAFDLVGCRPLGLAERQRLLRLLPTLIGPPPGREGRFQPSALDQWLMARWVTIRPDGAAEGRGRGYLTRPPRAREWLVVRPGPTIGDRTLADFGIFAAALMTEAMRRAWFVRVRFAPGTPSLQLPTDPTGVRAFFKLRDIPDGKARRAALVNWVTDHWRADRNDPEDEVYVREHLRGARAFTWRGLSGEIHVPEEDLARAGAAAERRRRMSPAEARRKRRRG